MRKHSNENIQTLGATSNIMNILGGGVSEPAVHFIKETDHLKIIIRVPGVEPETLKVEISDNRLIILHMLEIHTTQNVTTVPRIILNRALAHYIQIEGITASCDGTQLIIKLPFNERSNGYDRSVKIERR